MNVASVSDINFQAKQRYVQQTTNEKIKQVLSKMNDEAIVINDTKSHMLKSVSVDGDCFLRDNRTSVSQPQNLALMDVGENTQLVIDTTSGEIIDSRKSFFSSWNGILKKVTKSVDKMLKHFDDEKVVNREYRTVPE